jgi:hypothetical protein
MAVINNVFTGALGVIKVNGQPVGLMRNVRVNESFRRVPVRGLGAIVPLEAPVTEWAGTLSCSFWEIDYTSSGIPDAILRAVGISNAVSQIASGNNTPNFEDNLVLNVTGVEIDIYKKATDTVDSVTGLITPKLTPYAIVGRCLIESDNVNLDEGNISGRDQTFQYLDPIVFPLGA